jgi:RND superfamily putative drug exporter
MKLNVTARAARWSAAHWKTATVLWLAFAMAAVALGTVAGSKKLSDTETATGETARAETILQQAGFKRPAGESVLVQSRARAGGARADGRGQVERAIASTLFLSLGAVEKNIASIFTKLQLQQSGEDHRRVLAVLAYLQQD